MKIHCHWRCSLLLAYCLAEFVLATDGFAATKIWTNSVSGLWGIGSTNWGPSGAAPASGDTAYFTNAGTKTVTVNANTPAINSVAKNLTVGALSGARNTLLLTGLAPGQAFQITGQLAINHGGELAVSNAALQIPSGEFNNNGGTVTHESGTMDLSSASLTRIGRYSTNTASMTVKSGVVRGTSLQIGSDLSQGTLILSNGLVTLSSYLQLGYSSTGNPITGGTGIVAVAGGQFLMTNDVANIGSRGPGTLTLSGGTATFALLSLGEVAGVQGMVSVAGGQLITLPGTVPVSPFTNIFRVGNQGSGELDISGGAAVIMTALSIADNPGSTGLVFITGGQLLVTNDLTSIGKYGMGQMTISNATATVTNASVGRHDTANGTLTVLSNGNFFALDDLSIGRFTNSLGSVLVAGGLLSLTNANIWVGRDGTGDLTVSSGIVRAATMFVGMSEDNTNTPVGTVELAGGTILLSSNLVIGTSLLSTGQVSVAGGNFNVVNGAGTATLKLLQGTFTLGSGSVTADEILITNSGGQFTFTGGTLQAGNITVDNGAPFTVGDGVNPAMLQLIGGTYRFANGLVIASNATVTGCGTIIGTISNSGTLNTNCGATATVTLGNLSQVYDGSAKSATAGTIPTGLTVSLTYNGSVNAPTNAGSYQVIGTVVDANHTGSATNTLVIRQASATVTLGDLSQVYDGSAKSATAGTTPVGLTVSLTYNGSANAPTNAGSYQVVGTVTNPNYTGGATNTLVISPASAKVTITGMTKVGATATIFFSTISGSNHVLEYKSLLGDTSWSAILPAVTGNGSVMSTSDPNATNVARFYRVQLQ